MIKHSLTGFFFIKCVTGDYKASEMTTFKVIQCCLLITAFLIPHQPHLKMESQSRQCHKTKGSAEPNTGMSAKSAILGSAVSIGFCRKWYFYRYILLSFKVLWIFRPGLVYLLMAHKRGECQPELVGNSWSTCP